MSHISLQLHQISRVLDERFSPHVHRRGILGKNQEQDQIQIRSRALAAMAAHVVSGTSEEEAGKRVTDNYCDDGIDAFAVERADSKPPILYLIQAKWSDKGNHDFKVSETSSLVNGFDKLQEDRLHPENILRDHREEIDEVMATPGAQVVLVFASSGDKKVPPHTRSETENAIKRHTRDEIPISIRYLLLADFVKVVESGVSQRGVTASAPLLRNQIIDQQPCALQGTINANELGNWYKEHGHAIFDDNVRIAGSTSTSQATSPNSAVNKEIKDSLLKEPENFWYFNNGVTALCQNWARAMTNSREVPYHFFGLRIVNGAQTVSAISEAMDHDPKSVAMARVPVRFIALEQAGPRFGTRIAYSTNRSNPMEPRDLLAMDHVQQRLRDEFALTWGRDYAIRANDTAPDDSNGCSILESVIAMACGRHCTYTLVDAKKEITTLWNTRSDSYRKLFNDHTSVVEVWRRVQIMREVRKALDDDCVIPTQRMKNIAALGDMIIAHGVFQKINDENIGDIRSNWEEIISSARNLALEILNDLTAQIEYRLTLKQTSKNRWKDVAALVNAKKKWLDELDFWPRKNGTSIVSARPSGPWPSEPKFSLIIRGECRANGVECDGGFLVRAGSLAAATDHDSLPSAQLSHRRNLRNSLGLVAVDEKILRLTRDVVFESPSQAAGVLLGHSANGAKAWIAEGRTYNEIVKQRG